MSEQKNTQIWLAENIPGARLLQTNSIYLCFSNDYQHVKNPSQTPIQSRYIKDQRILISDWRENLWPQYLKTRMLHLDIWFV